MECISQAYVEESLAKETYRYIVVGRRMKLPDTLGVSRVLRAIDSYYSILRKAL